MHVIKGGWLGQTFALAKCNDSGGKKSRIRRSKEERKTMVESFIKKYQNVNNGNFPSLNLTHKEVGGSFYTVREIVREVIQENRVLGPAKFSLEDQNNENFLEEYPLGSISSEPQTHLFVSNGTYVTTQLPNLQFTDEEEVFNSSGQLPRPEHERSDDRQVIDRSIELEAVEDLKESDELVFNSSGQLRGPEHWRFDDGQVIKRSGEAAEDNEEYVGPVIALVASNDHRDTSDEHVLDSGGNILGPVTQMIDTGPVVNGSSRAVEGSKESDKTVNTESWVSGSLDRDKNGAKALETSKARRPYMTADIVVETFPPSPVSETVCDLDQKPGEEKESAGMLDRKETKGMELGAGDKNFALDEINFLENFSGLMDERAEVSVKAPVLDQDSEIVDKKAMVNNGHPPFESSTCSTTKESVVLYPNNDKGLEVKDAMPAEIKPINDPNGIHAENLNRTNSSSSQGQSISEEPIATKTKTDIQNSGRTHKGNKPTLDRINLESWEGSSEKSTGRGTNPLSALLKAFISAFVKFWTE